MRLLEIIWANKGEKYILHIDESCSLNALMLEIEKRIGFFNGLAVLYQPLSGRFLSGGLSIKEAGIESGDIIMLISNIEEGEFDGTN